MDVTDICRIAVEVDDDSIQQVGRICFVMNFFHFLLNNTLNHIGVLQFDVLKFRLENEYNVEIRLENLPYEHIRWIENKDEVDVDNLIGTSDMKKIIDMKGNPLLLFVNAWSVGMVLDRNEGLVLAEFGTN